MIEQAIYFALGCIVTALGALMFAPLFWNRALRLTRQRMQLQIPVSMQEIYAERDGLRADFAVRQLRLEQEVERVRAGKARDMAEIGKRSMQASKYADELAAMRRTAEERAAEIATLKQTLAERDAAAAAAAAASSLATGTEPTFGALVLNDGDAATRRSLEGELAAARNALADAREREKNLHIENGMKAEKARGLERAATERLETLQAENVALRDQLDAARRDKGTVRDKKVDGELRESIHSLGLAVAAMTRNARAADPQPAARQDVDAH